MSGIVLPTPAMVHKDKSIGKQFGSFDGLDNRRELYRLLERLGDGVPLEVGCARRRQFFAWCCRAASRNSGMKVEVDPKTVGLTAEIYRDINAITCFPGMLDITDVARKLERVVRNLA